MSYTAGFDDGGEFQVASNSGWGDFAASVRGLDPATYPDLIHLVEYGWDQDLGPIRDQLSAAIEGGTFPRPDILATAKGLLGFLDGRGGAAAMVIGQGFEGDPQDDTMRSLSRRFNPNHDPANGEFSDGSGGDGGSSKADPGKSGSLQPADRAEASRLIDGAAAHGMDIGLTHGGPSNRLEETALAKADASGKLAISVTETPKVISTTSGDIVTYSYADPGVSNDAGGDIYAKVYPDPGGHGWIGERKDAQYDPEKVAYDSRSAAVKASEKFMASEQKARTQRSARATKSAARVVADTLDQYDMTSQAAKGWSVRIKVVTR